MAIGMARSTAIVRNIHKYKREWVPQLFYPHRTKLHWEANNGIYSGIRFIGPHPFGPFAPILSGWPNNP